MLPEVPDGWGMIGISSIVGVKHGPQVVLTWGENKAFLTPAEARAHAMQILLVADGAETDGFVANFMEKTVGLDRHKVAAVLADFRRYREAQTSAKLNNV